MFAVVAVDDVVVVFVAVASIAVFVGGVVLPR